MNNLRNPKLLFIMLVLLPIVLSCAQIKSWVTPKSSAKTPSPAQDSSKPPSQTPAQSADLAKKHIEAGDCQKAMDVYYVEYRKHPSNQALVGEYVKSIENIKSTADQALDKEDFASAGRKYDVLLKNYVRFKGFEKKLSFKNTHLNEKLYYCKKALFKKGFQEYRKENISAAISLWQDLFAIDPQNADVQKLLRTAKLQQKNLLEKE